VIETGRLRMRSLYDGDLIDLVTLAGNWEVARWLATMPHPYTGADAREWIACVQQDHATGRPRRFAIALKETDRLELIRPTRNGARRAPLFRISQRQSGPESMDRAGSARDSISREISDRVG